VHEKGDVVIAASSTDGDHWQPKNVAEHESYYFFASKDEPNQWICLEFIARLVRLTAYAGGPGYSHPKSWVIEASSDGAAWSEPSIDRRENNQDLNDWS